MSSVKIKNFWQVELNNLRYRDLSYVNFYLLIIGN